jgi:hypothetical protein
MILGFKERFENGEPTYFIDKIWNALIDTVKNRDAMTHYQEYRADYERKFSRKWQLDEFYVPKLHTIRTDASGRWKVNMDIHFSINVRKPGYWRFAPVVPVIGIQRIEIKEMVMAVGGCIKLKDERVFVVEVDGRRLEKMEIEQLAKNDGFEGAEEFFGWFKKDFVGKIIHWTELRY